MQVQLAASQLGRGRDGISPETRNRVFAIALTALQAFLPQMMAVARYGFLGLDEDFCADWRFLWAVSP